GMRAKLYARGSGKWAKSGGEAAKFGLTTPEMLEAVKILKSRRMLDAMVMLHFHIGSQITDIRKVKLAIREAGRVYAKRRVLDVADRIEQDRRVRVTSSDAPVIQELAAILASTNAKNLRESYHDALQYKEETFTLFNLGHLSLEDRSKGEILFWHICERIHR